MAKHIIAYADTHLGTAETLKELELQPDYSFCDKLYDVIERIQHDLVICCGDFTEALWDEDNELEAECGGYIQKMRDVTDIYLCGNHDPIGQDRYVENEFTFLHGHQWERASEGFVERLHQKAEQYPAFIIMGHSHHPALGKNFMDIGSLTLTGTYGEIMDGKAYLRDFK